MAVTNPERPRRQEGEKVEDAGSKRNNRDRILETSLQLFNELGSVAVSTKVIAEQLGISPGNFYYHFTDKEHVIRELLSQLEGSVMPFLAVPEDGSAPAPEALAAFFVAIVDSTLRYRFISRDIDELMARDPEFAATFRSELQLGAERTLGLFATLVEHGIMSRPRHQGDLERLCTNIHLHLLNWTRFLSTVQGKTNLIGRDIAEGALHAFVMLAPYLDAEYADRARVVLERRRSKRGEIARLPAGTSARRPRSRRPAG